MKNFMIRSYYEIITDSLPVFNSSVVFSDIVDNIEVGSLFV